MKITLIAVERYQIHMLKLLHFLLLTLYFIWKTWQSNLEV